MPQALRVLDPSYPLALRDLAEPPDPLCFRGDLPVAPGVAIVGTRHPSEGARDVARSLARTLAGAGVVVWSGGAVGIDAAAHEGALDVAAPTVVVMGTGFDHVYPACHAGLYERVVAGGGALVAPFDDVQPPTTWTFLRRNGVLAAFTRALVVVQAGLTSGARSAARWARRLGRPVFVVPASPWDDAGAGCYEEQRLGARPLLDAAELLRVVGVDAAPAPIRARAPAVEVPAPRVGAARATRATRAASASATNARSAAPLPFGGAGAAPEPPAGFDADLLGDAARRVWDALAAGPRHPDEVCSSTGLRAPAVLEALLTLTLEAVLVEGPDGRYLRASR